MLSQQSWNRSGHPRPARVQRDTCKQPWGRGPTHTSGNTSSRRDFLNSFEAMGGWSKEKTKDWDLNTHTKISRFHQHFWNFHKSRIKHVSPVVANHDFSIWTKLGIHLLHLHSPSHQKVVSASSGERDCFCQRLYEHYAPLFFWHQSSTICHWILPMKMGSRCLLSGESGGGEDIWSSQSINSQTDNFLPQTALHECHFHPVLQIQLPRVSHLPSKLFQQWHPPPHHPASPGWSSPRPFSLIHPSQRARSSPYYQFLSRTSS